MAKSLSYHEACPRHIGLMYYAPRSIYYITRGTVVLNITNGAIIQCGVELDIYPRLWANDAHRVYIIRSLAAQMSRFQRENSLRNISIIFGCECTSREHEYVSHGMHFNSVNYVQS
jgi:hypothetical protein